VHELVNTLDSHSWGDLVGNIQRLIRTLFFLKSHSPKTHQPIWDPCYDKIFLGKLAILTQNKAMQVNYEKIIITVFFRKMPILGRKSQKIVIITSTPDNGVPRLGKIKGHTYSIY
jgi:hypothetical protein